MKMWKFTLALAAAGLPAFVSADLASLKRAAIGGSLDAQLELGVLYEFGHNYPTHDLDALAWYAIAAERGNALAATRKQLVSDRLSEADRTAVRRIEDALRAQLPAATAPVDLARDPPAAATDSAAAESRDVTPSTTTP